MYQIFPEHVKRLADGKTFGFTPGDPDFDEYMVWINAGNFPLPRDPDTPQQIALGKIDALERQHLAPRFMREFLLSAISPTAPAYVKLKALDDQIVALRTKL